MLRVAATAILTCLLTSFFWLWFYSSNPGNGRVSGSGDIATIDSGPGNPVSIAEGVEVGPAGLVIPVAGVKSDQLVDTFTASRAGGARRHDAIDIMASEGTPVFAVADGTIEKLFNSVRGGITVYQRSPDRLWTYYYAHLSSYAPGLHEGQRIKRGQLVGRVGHTGDASAAGPHLHFAINRMTPQEKWWHGTPINPYPLLAGKRVSG